MNRAAGGGGESLALRSRAFQRGEAVYRTGDSLRSVYLLFDGAFKTVAIGEGGDERIIGFHLPGEPIGLDAFGAQRHRCDAVALTAAYVCELPFDQFAKRAFNGADLVVKALSTVGASIARDMDHADMLSRRSPTERVALFLYSMLKRLRCEEGGLRFRLPMGREEIGRFLGLATETVSRVFTRLQKKGVILVDRRSVEICDTAGLRRAARPSDARDDVARIEGNTVIARLPVHPAADAMGAVG